MSDHKPEQPTTTTSSADPPQLIQEEEEQQPQQQQQPEEKAFLANGTMTRSQAMRSSRKASLELSNVFPQQHLTQQMHDLIHHERIFEGMMDEMMLDQDDDQIWQERHENLMLQSHAKEEGDEPMMDAVVGEDEYAADEEGTETKNDSELEDSSNKRESPIRRRHSSYESRLRRESKAAHDRMKRQLQNSHYGVGVDELAGSRHSTKKMELMEHLQEISMDLSALMKSSTGFSVDGLEPTDVTQSCPVLSYVMDDDDVDSLERYSKRCRRHNPRRRSRVRADMIPEEGFEEVTVPSQISVPQEPPRTYTVDLPEEEDEKPRAAGSRRRRRSHSKRSSYHVLMNSMYLADDVSSPESVWSSFSHLMNASINDVTKFPTGSREGTPTSSNQEQKEHTMTLKPSEEMMQKYILSSGSRSDGSSSDDGSVTKPMMGLAASPPAPMPATASAMAKPLTQPKARFARGA